MERIFSKVILSGEHSVLRGGLSIVAPFKKHSLSYVIKDSHKYSLCLSEKVKPYEILIQGTLEQGLSVLEKSLKDLKSEITINSIVPLGKGLGGSAALCVFVSKVMNDYRFISEDQIFNFSKELENIFHGESSGVDIAGCVCDDIQGYIRGYSPKPFKPKLKTHLYLSSTNEVGSTDDCIEKVLLIKSDDLEKFNQLDEKMNEASKSVLLGLVEDSFQDFNRGLKAGAEVFRSWGLYTDKMKSLEEDLLSRGALVVKPTGSGLGGFMISSFKEKQELKNLPEGSLELEL